MAHRNVVLLCHHDRTAKAPFCEIEAEALEDLNGPDTTYRLLGIRRSKHRFFLEKPLWEYTTTRILTPYVSATSAINHALAALAIIPRFLRKIPPLLY